MGSVQAKTGQINPYSIEISPEAQRGLLAISRANRRFIIDAIDGLANDPRPSNSKLLHKAQNLRRLTIGDYRVIYGIQESLSLITIEMVRHRSIVYLALSTLALSVRTKKYSK